VCCSVLQCVVVCCSVLHCVAVCYRVSNVVSKSSSLRYIVLFWLFPGSLAQHITLLSFFWVHSRLLRVGRTMLKIHRGTPCSNIRLQAWCTTFLKTLTAKWSWFRRGCGYCSSILDFLEQLLGSELVWGGYGQ